MSSEFSSLMMSRFAPVRPAGGSALRNCQNIHGLSRLGPVDVVTVGGGETSEPAPGVREWRAFSHALETRRRRGRAHLWTRLWLLRPGAYFELDHYQHEAVEAWLRRAAIERRYTVAVIAEHWFARYVPLLRRLGLRVVYDAHNVESALHRDLLSARGTARETFKKRWRRRLLEARMEAEERRLVRRSQLVWACSEPDAVELRGMNGGATPVTVIPNGVDVDSYRRANAVAADVSWTDWPVTLVFPGSYSYYPNEEAALQLIRGVLPALRARGCQARLFLIGRDPTPAMLDAAGADEAIRITGPVESVLPYLESPCVVPIPLKLGGGTRLKVLEAFALGRPVVSSRKGAEGIDATDGRHLLLRDEAEGMADAVLDLWHNTARRAAQCREALTLVRARYSWAAAAQGIAASLCVAPPPVEAPPIVAGRGHDGV